MRKLSKAKLAELREIEEKRITGYNYLRQVWVDEILANAPPELIDILAYIAHVSPLEGEATLGWLESTGWLMEGDPDWRYLILRAISDRHSELTGIVLDDPLPGQSDWFFRAREMLKIR